MIITLVPGSSNWIMTAGVRKMMTTMKRMRRIQLSTQIGAFVGEEESQSAATSPSLMRHQCRHTPTFRKLSMVLLSQFTTLPLPGDQKGLKKYRPGGRKSKRIALQIFFFLSIIQSISVKKKSVFSLVYLFTPMISIFKGGERGSSVGRARGSWWGGPEFDSRCGCPLPTGWVGVSIMWPAETEMVSYSSVLGPVRDIA